jgi:biotin operon repressor
MAQDGESPGLDRADTQGQRDVGSPACSARRMPPEKNFFSPLDAFRSSGSEPPPGSPAMSIEPPKKNRLSLDPTFNKIVVEGAAPFGSKAVYKLMKFLVEQHIEDRNSGLAPENYRYTSARDLMDKLNIDDEALRQQIRRLRARFRAVGLDAIIQTKNRAGYRLDPLIWVLALSELAVTK